MVCVVNVGDISIIFPCSFAVGITQQYGIYGFKEKSERT